MLRKFFCCIALITCFSLVAKGDNGIEWNPGYPTAAQTLPSQDDDTLCPVKPNFLIPGRPWMARLAFVLTGGEKAYRNADVTHAGQALYLRTQDLPSIYHNPLPHRIPLKTKLCIYTSSDSILDGSRYQLDRRTPRQTERAWVNFLLGSFLLGDGPENILFTDETFPSQCIRECRLMKKALRNYFGLNTENKDTISTFHTRFWLDDLFLTLTQPLSLRHFIGSAEFRITQCSDSSITVVLINVTSLTSADMFTHFRRKEKWPRSIPRQLPVHPLSNTRQIFHTVFSLEEAKKLAGI